MCDHHGVDRNVTAHPPTGVHRPAGELDDRLDEAVGKLADQVVSWRHQIHGQPELSNREVKTSELVAEHFRTLDLDEVRTGIAGYGVVGSCVAEATGGGLSRFAQISTHFRSRRRRARISPPA